MEPFLKWAGGKRWLVNQHPSIFPAFPGKYVEPFLGSGAVFFHLQPKAALLSDRNRELIEAYRVVRRTPGILHNRLAQMHDWHCKKFYYQTRRKEPSSRIERAARFVYLNRTCWNGLYRVNRRGQFNVPIGTKTTVAFPPRALLKISKTLKSAELAECDFEITIDRVGAGDFLFVDPPYTVSHNNNGFVKYNNVLFSWEDQIRLAKSVERASARGAFVFVSNAHHDALVALYCGFADHYTLRRSSILSGNSSGRREIEEAVFVNYLPGA